METFREFVKDLGLPTTDKAKETPDERRARLKEQGEKRCRWYNESEGYLDPMEYDCKRCNNRGGFMEMRQVENEEYKEILIPCKCMKTREIIRKLDRSGLKGIVHKYTFDNFKDDEEWQKNAKKLAKDFVNDEENKWFFFGGQSGAGKTALCTAITVAYIKKDLETRYMLWRDDITRIKMLVTDAEQYQKAIDDLKSVAVLYIDDLFKTGARSGDMQPTTADINVAYEIINYRYNSPELITIISSEYTLRDILNIDESLGGRIAEKTIDAGYCINIKKDPNKNYRTKGIKEI